MEQRRDSIIHRIDWTTIVLYGMLASMGWLAICGASHSYIETSFLEFFDQDERSGKQALWMGISLFAGLILLCIKKHTYRNLSGLIYLGTLLVCIVTIFIAKDIKGSHSWISIGSFSIQPAEFMKFATALTLAAYMGRRGFNIKNNSDFMKCVGIIMIPMLIIIAQNETGSALVYMSLFLVLYREGMTGIFILMAISAIVYFVVGIKFNEETFENLPMAIGPYAVTVLIQVFSIAMVKFWCKHNKTFLVLLVTNATITLAAYWIAVYLIGFNVMIVQYLLLTFNVIYLLLRIRLNKEKKNLWIALYIFGSIAFYSSCECTTYLSHTRKYVSRCY